MTDTPRYLLVCTVKDEGPNILEWVAYHRTIGFTDIVIYENDSFDLTDRTLRVLDRIGAIRYFPNSFRPGAISPPFQNRAYRRASQLDIHDAADWCMALDSDEFLKINCGSGTVADLTAAVDPAFDAIRINWRIFGSSGLRTLDNRLVTERFTQTTFAENVTRRPHPVKTIYRPRAFARPGIHQPRLPRIAAPRICTGSGVALEEVTVRAFQNTDPGAYRLAQVNHYILRDADSFLIKSARGSSSHPERDIRLTYWKKRNHAQTEDDALAQLAPQTRAEMQALDQEAGGKLLVLRRRSLALWHERIAAMKTDAAYSALYDNLI